MPSVNTVNEYIAAQPKAVQTALRRVRAIIRKAVPDAEEIISYKIPAYRLHRRIILFFAGWTHHYSLYPAGDTVVAKFGKQLQPYDVRRGTIRFPLDEPVPAKLIERIAKFRAKAIAGNQKGSSTSKTAARKTPKRVRR